MSKFKSGDRVVYTGCNIANVPLTIFKTYTISINLNGYVILEDFSKIAFVESNFISEQEYRTLKIKSLYE